MGSQQLDFAEFYRESCDDCLRTVLVSVGDLDTAQDLVDEAFARALARWRTVSRHPAPVAWVVRTALNANISRWRRRRREVPVPDPGTVADLAAGTGDELIHLPAAVPAHLDFEGAFTVQVGHQVCVISHGGTQKQSGRPRCAARR